MNKTAWAYIIIIPQYLEIHPHITSHHIPSKNLTLSSLLHFISMIRSNKNLHLKIKKHIIHHGVLLSLKAE